MVPCYGFRLLFTIVLTKGSLKLLSKNWFIAYLSMNGGINCIFFVRCSYYFECFEKINFLNSCALKSNNFKFCCF